MKCTALMKNKMIEYLFCPHQNALDTKISSKPVNAAGSKKMANFKTMIQVSFSYHTQKATKILSQLAPSLSVISACPLRYRKRDSPYRNMI